MRLRILYIFLCSTIFFPPACKKSGGTPDINPVLQITINSALIDNTALESIVYGTSRQPVIKIAFSQPVLQSTVNGSVVLTEVGSTVSDISVSFKNNDSILLIQPSALLKPLTKYSFSINTSLKSKGGENLGVVFSENFITSIDSSGKFPSITDDSLLTLIQQKTFKYFWDFGHPVSGLARERSNGDNEVVTTGGSGFGIMSIPVAIERGFISRSDGLVRLQKIVSFLSTKPPRFHGAYSHWMSGTTGAVVPFASNDNGADLVETSYLMMGLLTARQYFNGSGTDETVLRDSINAIYNTVDWDWFRQGGKKVLYWNWSPDYAWAVNVPVQGWNECLITYVMAASSSTHPITKSVYDSGFARNGAMVNGRSFYGYMLPLGQDYGGPLFFSHYSFLGIDPNGLIDAYADYSTQTKNHSLINYTYCINNPNHFFGYSDQCWGLTASDISGGYTASSPTNDVSVIAPTAAISSLPYTPVQSMKALKFFYYVLGDKIFKDDGFVDAFSLQHLWYANSFLAIDQGPQIVMIENYRTGLVWKLFTSCPEVKNGMKMLGFSAPYL